jgi:hypothetical protein
MMNNMESKRESQSQIYVVQQAGAYAYKRLQLHFTAINDLGLQHNILIEKS